MMRSSRKTEQRKADGPLMKTNERDKDGELKTVIFKERQNLFLNNLLNISYKHLKEHINKSVS